MEFARIVFASLALAFVASACSSSESSDVEVTPGTVAQGEACRSNLDCSAVEGRTVKCRCTDQASVPICVTLQKAGESCAITGNFQLECAPQTTCVGTTSMEDVTCQPVSALGHACGGVGNVQCSDDLSCTNELCAVGAGTLGADCFDDSDCGPSYHCDFMTGCVERIALGQSCEDAGMPTRKTCVDGAACDAFEKVCVALKDDGAECFSDAECKSLECSLGGCGPNYRLGKNDYFGCGF